MFGLLPVSFVFADKCIDQQQQGAGEEPVPNNGWQFEVGEFCKGSGQALCKGIESGFAGGKDIGDWPVEEVGAAP